LRAELRNRDQLRFDAGVIVGHTGERDQRVTELA
jgi:hypothetical protein